MAKINNVGLNLGQKIANPFKTSRNSTTNPFKFSNFEGNTLQFADVFEGFQEPKNTSKLKMISSSVAGSMTKLHSSITEPIVNFVNRVRSGISNAWDYAKNTNVSDLAGIKGISNALNTDIVDIGKGLTNSISDMGKGLSEKMAFLNTDVSDIGKGLSNKMSFLNTDITEIGKGLSDRWSALIVNINHNHSKANMSVAELKNMWLEDIAASGKEVA